MRRAVAVWGGLVGTALTFNAISTLQDRPLLCHPIRRWKWVSVPIVTYLVLHFYEGWPTFLPDPLDDAGDWLRRLFPNVSAR